MKILAVAPHSIENVLARWSNAGINALAISYDNAIGLIEGPTSPDAVFDAIVLICTNVPEEDWDSYERGTPEDALWMAGTIRTLEPNIAMYDGKQWRAVPIAVMFPDRLLPSIANAREVADTSDLSSIELVVGSGDTNYGLEKLKQMIVGYRRAVLDEFDDMGFIIRVERGRYMVGPALKPRSELSGKYYFGPADQRPQGFTTVHKENFAVQAEVEAFEALINREHLPESELQRFFEEHPHFLSETHTPLSQVRLPTPDGGVLIPDFILKPIFAQRNESSWEVLELKLPDAKLLSGKGSRRRLSSRVIDAIAQLRDYRRLLESPEQARQLGDLLGRPLKRPKFGVLIGRLANTDPEALESAQRDYADVKIVTYDEILERQQTQLEFQR